MTESRYDRVDDVPEEAHDALRELLFRLADDEYVLAERDIEWQIYAPTLESDLALANIAQDEFGHARLWYDLAQETGFSEAECLWEKSAEDWRHSTLVELPYEDGDWADPILRSYLYDTAERLRVEALADSSLSPIRDRVPKILEEEAYHLDHAQSWLERLTVGGGDDAGSDDSHQRVQAALNRLFPAALTLFEAGPHEEVILGHGFRSEGLDDLRAEWLGTVIPYLESLGLTVPSLEDASRPDAVGRDGEHTEHWAPLLAEFTHTYREFDFDHPVRLREGEVG